MEGSQVINNTFRALVKDANGDIIYWGGLQQIGGENLNQGGTRYPIELNRITEYQPPQIVTKDNPYDGPPFRCKSTCLFSPWPTFRRPCCELHPHAYACPWGLCPGWTAGCA